MDNSNPEVCVAKVNAIAQIVCAAIANKLVTSATVESFIAKVSKAIKYEL